jgi:hypothetical protein
MGRCQGGIHGLGGFRRYHFLTGRLIVTMGAPASEISKILAYCRYSEGRMPEEIASTLLKAVRTVLELRNVSQWRNSNVRNPRL